MKKSRARRRNVKLVKEYQTNELVSAKQCIRIPQAYICLPLFLHAIYVEMKMSNLLGNIITNEAHQRKKE